MAGGGRGPEPFSERQARARAAALFVGAVALLVFWEDVATGREALRARLGLGTGAAFPAPPPAPVAADQLLPPPGAPAPRPAPPPPAAGAPLPSPPPSPPPPAASPPPTSPPPAAGAVDAGADAADADLLARARAAAKAWGGRVAEPAPESAAEAEAGAPAVSEPVSRAPTGPDACSGRGTARPDGTCACPSGWDGKACERDLLPACEAYPGTRTPCYTEPGKSAPTCECAAQCAKAGIAHGTTACLRKVAELVAAPADLVKHDFDGERALVAVDRRAIPAWRPEANPYVGGAAATTLSVKDKLEDFSGARFIPPDRCPERCSGNGMCVTPPSASKPACQCFRGWSGRTCGQPHRQFCINQCSGHGECVRGFCRCEPGYHGIDCGAGGPERGGASPRIHVYDMAPSLTSWTLQEGTAAQVKGGYCTHRDYRPDAKAPPHVGDYAYQAQQWFVERVLNSEHYEPDPEKAELFVVPVWDLCKSGTGSQLQSFAWAALDHVKSTWPYWDRKQGRDHVVVLPDDHGACDLAKFDGFRDSIVVQSWGMRKPEQRGPHPCHVPGKDVVVPPTYGTRFGTSAAFMRQQLAQYAGKERDTLMFFAGAVDLGGSIYYSGGVRKGVWDLFHGQEGFKLVDTKPLPGNKLKQEQYAEGYSTAVFCLAPSGLGWGIRAYLAIFYGCIPVVVQDDVSQAFEEVLRWDEFSLQMNSTELPELPARLRGLPEARVAEMQRNLRCVRERFLWSSLFGSYVGERGDRDAFATTMHVLAARAKGAAPEMLPTCGGSAEGAKPICDYPCSPRV